jgi:signal transduction histidine kinase
MSLHTISVSSIQSKLTVRYLNLAAYFTMIGVTVGGVLATPRILDRWEITALLILFGAAFSRLDIKNSPKRRNIILLLFQTLIVITLLQYKDSALSFAILFFILSVVTGLFFSLRSTVIWIVIFFLIVTFSLARFNPWNYTFQYSIPYFGGFLFFGLISNAFQLFINAQEKNEKLLSELNAKNKQLEEYSAQVEYLSIIEERNRIAREMHDTIGHRLTIAAVQLEGAHRLLQENPEKNITITRNNERTSARSPK